MIHILLDQQYPNDECGFCDIYVVSYLQAEEIRGLKMQLESYHQLQAKPHRATQRLLRNCSCSCMTVNSDQDQHYKRPLCSMICSIRELEQQVQELDYALQSRNPSANPT